MRLAVLSFTRAGSECCRKLVGSLQRNGDACCGYVQERFHCAQKEIPGLVSLCQTLGEWTRERFQDADGIIFIGAAGIAVRAIAPYLENKQRDPAVVVVDEGARWAISLISGHLGGANALAGEVAKILGATAVITTATDGKQKIAIDLFARDAGLVVSDWELAKQVSAELLEDHPVGFFSDFSWPEQIPKGFTRKQSCCLHVWVTARKTTSERDLIRLFMSPESRILRLIPKIYYLGIGCRKHTAVEAIDAAIEKAMCEHNLAVEGIAAIGSIDIKEGEPGLNEAAAKRGAVLLTCTAAQLNALTGEFTASDFVRQVTGADNICERAALVCAGTNGKLLVKKQAMNGVTVAVAAVPWNERK